jgi:lipoprotein-anchoring transpeptidase ErfK/SrfK
VRVAFFAVRTLPLIRSSRSASQTPHREVAPSRKTRFVVTAGVVLGALLVPLVSEPSFAQTAEVTVTEAPPTSAVASEPTPTTSAPTTAAPTTAPPTSAAPVTEAPTTAVPATTPPVTVAPVDPVVDVVATKAPKATKAPAVVKKKKKSRYESVPVNPSARGAVSVDVSIARQTMYLKRGGQVWKTIRVSTGSGRRYCEKGKCGTAVTPRGRFRVYSRVSGWRTASLGRLYNPLYFRGGFAIHGSGSVPSYPASHGCVRVSLANARWLPSVIPNGTPVNIY